MTDSTAMLMILRRVREEWTEDKYCKDAFALDAHGQITESYSRWACKWCLDGILRRYANTLKTYRPLIIYMHTVAAITHKYSSLWDFNDDLGYHVAHALVCEAIARLEAQEVAHE